MHVLSAYTFPVHWDQSLIKHVPQTFQLALPFFLSHPNDTEFTMIVNTMFSYKYVFLSILPSVRKLT